MMDAQRSGAAMMTRALSGRRWQRAGLSVVFGFAED